jgi:outer membrane protein assembly factor BamB
LGKVRWVYANSADAGTEKTEGNERKGPGGDWRGGYGRHVLVVADGVVLCNLREGLVALSTKKGEKLWTAPGGLGFHAPLDVFVINGLVWTGHHPGDPAPPPVDDFNVARDLHTGEVVSTNEVSVNLQTLGHHHRCYRNKATPNYIISGKRGIELFDLDGDEHSRNNWIRGTCQYGVMPANGLLYAPPHSCGCYPEVMVRGFYAMSASRAAPARKLDPAGRLVRGPAFGKVTRPSTPDAKDPQDTSAGSEWPTFRANVQRGAVVDTQLAQKPDRAWKVKVGGRLSQPSVAAGTLLVSSLDQHTVYAFDAKTGRPRWSRTVGGPVDSPPTIHDGRLCLFGSADGQVYCLRLSDGELVWRFLAAPADRRTVVWGRIESVWPVHGSVLVLDGVAYLSAGRSTLFDQGIELYGLNPETGQVVYQTHYETPPPEFDKGKDEPGAKALETQHGRHDWIDYKTVFQSDRSRTFFMGAGTTSDVLVSDGTDVFLHHKRFNTQLEKQDTPARHLYAVHGLLNDTAGEVRTGWTVGTGDVRGKAGYGILRSGRRRGALAYDGGHVWHGWNLKAGGRLVKGGERDGKPVLLLAPADSKEEDAVIELDAPVVWDGVAAADGRLYVSHTDGRVVCYQ